MYKCRLCGLDSPKELFKIKNVPSNIQRLFKESELHLDGSVDLDILECERCQFVQIKPIVSDAYYDDYLMTTTHSRQQQEYQSRQAEDFVNRFQLNGKLIMEVGCGDGSYLDHLSQAGANALGVEPSARFRELALSKGYDIQDGYVNTGRCLNGSPFDAFVTRQVLEHVPDIHSFLSGIRENLSAGAFGLVEVPSLEKLVEDRRFYDFFPDHVNYFSLKTLKLALEMNGFDVLDSYQDMFDEYNIALVRVAETFDVGSVEGTVRSLAQEMQQFIASYHSKNQKVAIWGAGGKGLSVMATAGIRDIDLLVDGDPHKAHLYTPVSHLKVNAPSKSQFDDIDAVIITAMAYRNEIEDTLRNKYEFKGAIAVLGHTLEISNNDC